MKQFWQSLFASSLVLGAYITFNHLDSSMVRSIASTSEKEPIEETHLKDDAKLDQTEDADQDVNIDPKKISGEHDAIIQELLLRSMFPSSSALKTTANCETVSPFLNLINLMSAGDESLYGPSIGNSYQTLIFPLMLMMIQQQNMIRFLMQNQTVQQQQITPDVNQLLSPKQESVRPEYNPLANYPDGEKYRMQEPLRQWDGARPDLGFNLNREFAHASPEIGPIGQRYIGDMIPHSVRLPGGGLEHARANGQLDYISQLPNHRLADFNRPYATRNTYVSPHSRHMGVNLRRSNQYTPYQSRILGRRR